MSKRKQNAVKFKDYESALGKDGYEVGYIRLLELQLVCMNELSPNAFRLYVMMKSYAQQKNEFTFPYRIYKNFLSKQTFVKVREELINLGYVEPFVSYKNLRTENKYKFSSKWRERNKDKIKEIINQKKHNKK